MKRKDIKDNPDLRLSEFSEPYSYKRFGDLLAKESRSFKMEDESEYRLVTVKRAYRGVILRGVFKGKKVLVKSQFLLKSGDFLISKRQICHNACGIVPPSLEGAIISNEYTVFLPKKDLDIVYFRYFCCLPIVSHTFFLSSIGVHIEKMLFKVDDWLKWEFPFPSLPEQQKIASFLAAVDKKIEQLTRKKELLEQYKKGVMQKIFSQEIRFKDENGQDYPDWEETRLGDILVFFTTNLLSRNDLTYDAGNIYNIHYGDIHKSYKTVFDIEKEQVPFIKNDIATDKIKKESFCKVGDVVIADASEDYADIGKSIELWNLSDKKVVAGLHTFLGRDEKNKTVIGFKGYLLQSNLIRRQIQRNAQGAAVLGISKRNLSNVVFDLPHKNEQSKIANILTSIDKRIKFVQYQLTQTQNFKKGLLQKMFV